jgi:hypothetical protein
MGHTLRHFFTRSPKKGHKGWLVRRIPEGRIKINKCLRINSLKKIILSYDFLRNLALKQCDPYMVTPVGIRV